jgi:hypothetical protein
MAKAAWLERRRAGLLPVPYFHAVFTLPHELNAATRHHRALIYVSCSDAWFRHPAVIGASNTAATVR